MSPSLFTNFPHLSPVYHDSAALVSPIMSKSPSIASDGMSMVSGLTTVFPSYIGAVNPPPVYIAQPSASEVVTQVQRGQRVGSISEDEDGPVEQDRAIVAESAVALVNAFLDKLLYDFLSAARSTGLLALKSAVADTLKKSMGRDAIASADANLEDLLALQDDDDDDEATPKASSPRDLARWNLEFVWKRTRLRVMMRSEKSEFDIDDDDRYVQDEGLLSPGRRFSQSASTISLSAEIFLAGVLDYVAEQLLSMACGPAASRARRQGRSSRSPAAAPAYHVVVEDNDVEKGVLNSSMDRQWRTWRKSLRARGLSMGFARASPYSPSTGGSPVLTRGGSYGGTDSSPFAEDDSPRIPRYQQDVMPEVPELNYPEHILASNIPLPIGRRDVDEIEVPGLARDPDQNMDLIVAKPRRRSSLDYKQTQYEEGLIPVSSKATSHNDTHAALVLGKQPSVPGTPVAWSQDTKDIHGLGIVNGESANNVSELDTDGLAARSTPGFDLPGAWPSSQTPASDSTPGPYPAQELPISRTPEGERSVETIIPISDPEESGPPQANTAEQSMTQRVQELLRGGRATEVEDPLAGNAKDQLQDNYARNHAVEPSNGHPSESQALEGAAVVAVSSVGAMAGSSTLPGTRRVAPGAPSTIDEYEKLDHRKSLLDVKSLISDPDQDQSEDQTQQDVEPTHRARDSFTLGHPSTLPVLQARAEPQHLPAENMYRDRDREVSVGAGRLSSSSPPSTSSSLPVSRYSLSSSPIPGSPKTPTPYARIVQRPGEETTWTTAIPPSARELTAYHNNGPFVEPSYSPASQPNSSSPRSPQHVTKEFMKSPKGFRRQEFDSPGAPVNVESQLNGEVASRHSIQKVGVARNGVLIPEGPSSTTPVKKVYPLTSASITSPEDFDLFVQGDDTMKYTLTPDAVRAPPVSIAATRMAARANRAQSNSSPTVRSGSRLQSRDTAGETMRGGPVQMPPSQLGPVAVTPPSRAGVVTPAAGDMKSSERPQAERRISGSRPPPTYATLPGSTSQVPREPRIQTESTRDFADFIRSTGPDKAPDTLVPALKTRGSSHFPNGGLHSGGALSSADRTRSLTRSSMTNPEMQAQNVPPVPPVPANEGRGQAGGHAGMKAREAAGTTGIDPDFIDAIRNGPSTPSTEGKSRIAPGVEPVRTQTGELGNDEIRDLVQQVRSGNAIPRSIGPAGAAFDTPVGSAGPGPQTSAARSPALSNSGSRLSPNSFNQYSPTPRLNVPRGGAGPSEPLRKRHRNKDPYAIDFSDEDDDLLASIPQRAKADETLMDFLRTNDPPSNNGPVPITNAGPVEAKAIVERARASQAENLRAAQAAQSSSSRPNGVLPQTSNGTSMQPQSATNGAGVVPSGYAESVVTMLTNETTSAQRPAHITSNVSGPGSLPADKPRMETKGAGGSKNARLGAFHAGTGDLADFLRTSGPIDPATLGEGSGAPSPTIGKGPKVERKKGGKFWQRKRYLDMP